MYSILILYKSSRNEYTVTSIVHIVSLQCKIYMYKYSMSTTDYGVSLCTSILQLYNQSS